MLLFCFVVRFRVLLLAWCSGEILPCGMGLIRPHAPRSFTNRKFFFAAPIPFPRRQPFILRKRTPDLCSAPAESAEKAPRLRKSATNPRKKTIHFAGEMTAPDKSMTDAAQSMTDAAQSTTDAAQSTTDAAQSTTDAAQSATDAAQSATDAAQSTTDAAQSVTDAAQSVTDAAQSVTDAAQSVTDLAGTPPIFPASTGKTPLGNRESPPFFRKPPKPQRRLSFTTKAPSTRRRGKPASRAKAPASADEAVTSSAPKPAPAGLGERGCVFMPCIIPTPIPRANEPPVTPPWEPDFHPEPTNPLPDIFTPSVGAHPNGMKSFSPGLRGTSYPGWLPVPSINPEWVVSERTGE